MSTEGTKVRLSILKALQEHGQAAGAALLQQRLLTYGIMLKPRTIRAHLMQMDQEGLTRFVSRRRGREITTRGMDELSRGDIMERVGFVATKIDTLGYRMSFSLGAGAGTLITNVATVREGYLARAIDDMRQVFTRKLAMGTRLAVAREGETLAGLVVPPGMVGLGTVCSVTANGILLAEGIPVTSRFGALLEIKDGRPVRFVELIDYTGTTMDPLEVFIQAGMTRVRECARSGRGIIGASFREFPSVAINDVRRLKQRMEQFGLGGILMIGNPSQPLLEVPVAEGRTGMIIVAGLNPIAALHEVGVRMGVRSLSGLENYDRFRSFQVIKDKLVGYPRGERGNQWHVE